MGLDCLEGLVADIVFHTAGIFCGRLFTDTDIDQQPGEYCVAFINTLRQYFPGFCQLNITIVIFFYKAFVPEYL